MVMNLLIFPQSLKMGKTACCIYEMNICVFVWMQSKILKTQGGRKAIRSLFWYYQAKTVFTMLNHQAAQHYGRLYLYKREPVIIQVITANKGCLDNINWMVLNIHEQWMHSDCWGKKIYLKQHSLGHFDVAGTKFKERFCFFCYVCPHSVELQSLFVLVTTVLKRKQLLGNIYYSVNLLLWQLCRDIL